LHYNDWLSDHKVDCKIIIHSIEFNLFLRKILETYLSHHVTGKILRYLMESSTF